MSTPSIELREPVVGDDLADDRVDNLAAGDAQSTEAGHVRPQGRRGTSFRDAWRASYGSSWWIDLACLGVLVFLLGAFKPLDDPDLPLHLASGEWILRHGAVPFTEPFAWTRMGAPYYAYSWLLDVSYYGILRWCGPLGLHVLNGLMVAAIGAATIALGHAARWKPWVSLCLAGYGIGVASMIVSSLRPQLLILSIVPLTWAIVYHLLSAERIRWWVVALIVTSSIAANSHLFFVLTAAPVVLCYISPPRDWHRTLAICGAIILGWLLSPYALAWPDVFRLNFGYNALLVAPSPVDEFRPGFSGGFFGLVFAVALLLIPWGAGLDRKVIGAQAHRAYALYWLAGLVAFALAIRLLVVWWVLVLPAAAAALEPMGGREVHARPRLAVKLVSYGTAIGCLLLLVGNAAAAWRSEGNTVSRRLPVRAEADIGPLVTWLTCHTSPSAHGRIFTWFNYGSYLVWRLPSYSASVDGRTIFPDSVEKIEALTSGWLAPSAESHSVWSSADVAIVPRNFNVAAVLDAAPGWKLAAWTYDGSSNYTTVGLWVKRAWWDTMGRSALPERAHLQLASQREARGGACGASRGQ